MLKPSDWLLDPRGCPGFLKHELRARREKPPYISHTEYLHLEIPRRYALVNLTNQEDNGDAHLKSYLTNHAVTLPVTGGQLDFGTWQQVFYAEFDGQRRKRVLIKVTGLAP